MRRKRAVGSFDPKVSSGGTLVTWMDRSTQSAVC